MQMHAHGLRHFIPSVCHMVGFPGSSDGKESACNAGHLGLIPRLEDPLEEGMATHSSILAWRIPWMEEPGGLQPMGHRESDMTEQLTPSLSLFRASFKYHLLNIQKLWQLEAVLIQWADSCHRHSLSFPSVQNPLSLAFFIQAHGDSAHCFPLLSQSITFLVLSFFS